MNIHVLNKTRSETLGEQPFYRNILNCSAIYIFGITTNADVMSVAPSLLNTTFGFALRTRNIFFSCQN